VRDVLFPLAQALYLFAPLVLAGAISGAVLRFELFPGLRRPIDGGATFRGRRIFGDSKTWRGVAVAVVGCVAAAAIQTYLVAGVARPVAIVELRGADVVPFGVAMGAGAMLGELPNSFVKRQIGIAPGKTTSGPLAALFYVWDQVDLLTAAWPLISFWVRPTPRIVAASFVVALVIHPTVSLAGYLLHARKTAR
jgi:CDP-archaeol synthase